MVLPQICLPVQFRRLVRTIQSIAVTLNRHYPARLHRLYLVDAPVIVHLPVRVSLKSTTHCAPRGSVCFAIEAASIVECHRRTRAHFYEPSNAAIQSSSFHAFVHRVIRALQSFVSMLNMPWTQRTAWRKSCAEFSV